MAKNAADSVLDFMEGIVGGAEKVFTPPSDDGKWEVEEIIEDGRTLFMITDGSRKVFTKYEDLARRICSALNA